MLDSRGPGGGQREVGSHNPRARLTGAEAVRTALWRHRLCRAEERRMILLSESFIDLGAIHEEGSAIVER